ncbi:ABC transporter ATP-binding protein [Georgenia sp. Z1491]|uniref:ABC transporter ATP-binding protein n=1 Tax=Georgenia sp. Z1491 TaxID=3416707 RepID=UPI003CEFFDED
MTSSPPQPAQPSDRGGGGRLVVARRARRAWRELSPFFRGSGLLLTALVAVSVLAGLSEAGLLALIAAVAAALSTGESEVTLGLGPITLSSGVEVTLLAGVGLALVRAGLQLLLAYIPARLGANATADLRRRLFDAFTQAAWPIKASERDGHFQSLMNAHITSTSLAIVNIGNGFSALFTFGTMLVSALVLNLTAALALSASSLVLFLALRPLARRLRRHAKALSGENIEYSKGVQEIVLVAEETEVFGASDTYRSGVYETIDNVRRPLLRTRFLSAAVPAVFQSAALLLLILALFAVSLTGVGQIATLGAVVLILFRTLTYAQQVQTAVTSLDERIPFMERLARALHRYEANPQQDGENDLPEIRTIGFDQVHHSYRSDRPTLTDLSFTAGRGEAIGVAGPSGAGKSTVVQLLLRLREPTGGRVEVNGTDVRDFRRDQWRQRVAYVPQAPQLVWGTVADNIRFFRPHLTTEDVEAAAARANIHEEIMSWPQGYDTVVGQRASAVSGGQRQRLCLARALAGSPEVLILDEATSALDVRSEALVNDSLSQLRGSVTIILVSHRPSALSMCDRVMVLVDGRLQSMDAPSVLASSSAFYQEVTRLSGGRQS